jgi:hypothetical protein
MRMMNRRFSLFIALLSLCSGTSRAQDWTHFVRTSGHPCEISRIPRVMDDARKTELFGIEVDNDVPGRYISLLDPEPKLKAIKAMADSAHAAKNYAFVYVAGLECITDNMQPQSHSMFRDHPDWVQRNKKGEPAMFGKGAAFWIADNSEDVWVSPYAPEWRKLYMERIRQVAATGIDGIYVDIPYWMTHFTGWENTWASFDVYTVAEFKKRTGIDATTEVGLGNWNDPHFTAWVEFRIQTITEFMAEIDKNIKSVNPKCKSIAEIYPGTGEEAVRVGADVFSLYHVVDVIAHEFNVGGNSASREPAQWMEYMINMFTFRAFAQDKPTWMLSYSWDKEDKITPSDAMENLAMSQVMAGTNSWDASRFVMSGSNDYATRTRIFKWIKGNQQMIYAPRKAITPVAVYFSPETRNYFTDEFIKSYMGVMEMMMLNHVETSVVTPLTLNASNSHILILPDVKCLSDEEFSQLEQWLKKGKTILFTGEPGLYKSKRAFADNRKRIAELSVKYPHAIRVDGTPDTAYHRWVIDNYNESVYKGERKLPESDSLNSLLKLIKRDNGFSSAITVDNADASIVQIAEVNKHPTIFIANFSGLKGKENARQIPDCNIVVCFNHAPRNARVKFIPFLGAAENLEGKWGDGKLTVKLPTIFRGAIVSLQ